MWRFLIRIDFRGPLTRPPRRMRCPYCKREVGCWADLPLCAQHNHPSVPWTAGNGFQ